MINLHALFPQLSSLGFFGTPPAPSPTVNPFLAVYIATNGGVSPYDLATAIQDASETQSAPQYEEDSFLF